MNLKPHTKISKHKQKYSAFEENENDDDDDDDDGGEREGEEEEDDSDGYDINLVGKIGKGYLWVDEIADDDDDEGINLKNAQVASLGELFFLFNSLDSVML